MRACALSRSRIWIQLSAVALMMIRAGPFATPYTRGASAGAPPGGGSGGRGIAAATGRAAWSGGDAGERFDGLGAGPGAGGGGGRAAWAGAAAPPGPATGGGE